MSATATEAQPQHLAALALANRVRLTRAALKRQIAAGTTTVVEVLADPPSEVQTMTVSELLRAQVRWERTRARKFLFTVAIGENRTIGRLTTRQRLLLIEELRGRGG